MAAGTRRTARGRSTLAGQRPGAWPGTWDPLGVTADDDGTNVALWAEGAEAGSSSACSTSDGTEPRIALEEQTYRVLHGYVPGAAAGSAVRLPGPRPVGPGPRHALQPREAAGRPLRPGHRRPADVSRRPSSATCGAGTTSSATTRDSAPYVPRSVVVRDDFDWGDDAPPRHRLGRHRHLRDPREGAHRAPPGRARASCGAPTPGLAHPAVVEHLMRLGVTAVELLPVHHFVDEVHLARARPAQLLGLQLPRLLRARTPRTAPRRLPRAAGERVQGRWSSALHAAGLEVILDVVYNHTAEGNELGPTLAFRGIDNADYYRLGPTAAPLHRLHRLRQHPRRLASPTCSSW